MPLLALEYRPRHRKAHHHSASSAAHLDGRLSPPTAQGRVDPGWSQSWDSRRGARGRQRPNRLRAAGQLIACLAGRPGALCHRRWPRLLNVFMSCLELLRLILCPEPPSPLRSPNQAPSGSNCSGLGALNAPHRYPQIFPRRRTPNAKVVEYHRRASSRRRLISRRRCRLSLQGRCLAIRMCRKSFSMARTPGRRCQWFDGACRWRAASFRSFGIVMFGAWRGAGRASANDSDGKGAIHGIAVAPDIQDTRRRPGPPCDAQAIAA